MRKFTDGRLKNALTRYLNNHTNLSSSQSRFLSFKTVLDFATAMTNPSSSPVTLQTINPKVYS
ncbi:hypothetical protein CsatB_003110 [Cannabis sativa]